MGRQPKCRARPCPWPLSHVETDVSASRSPRVVRELRTKCMRTTEKGRPDPRGLIREVIREAFSGDNHFRLDFKG